MGVVADSGPRSNYRQSVKRCDRGLSKLTAVVRALRSTRLGRCRCEIGKAFDTIFPDLTDHTGIQNFFLASAPRVLIEGKGSRVSNTIDQLKQLHAPEPLRGLFRPKSCSINHKTVTPITANRKLPVLRIGCLGNCGSLRDCRERGLPGREGGREKRIGRDEGKVGMSSKDDQRGIKF